jgi:hypothetical protein
MNAIQSGSWANSFRHSRTNDVTRGGWTDETRHEGRDRRRESCLGSRHQARLTDAEIKRVDAADIARRILCNIRIRVKQAAECELSVDDYVLQPPANVIDLFGWLGGSGRRRADH